MWLPETKQLSQTELGMRALFLRCSGMRANQSAAVVYIASSLFCHSSGSVGGGGELVAAAVVVGVAGY